MGVFSPVVALTELPTGMGEQGLRLQRLIPPESADLDPSVRPGRAYHTTRQPQFPSRVPLRMKVDLNPRPELPNLGGVLDNNRPKRLLCG